MASVNHLEPHASFGEHGRTRLATKYFRAAHHTPTTKLAVCRTKPLAIRRSRPAVLSQTDRGRGGKESREEAVRGKKTESNVKTDQTRVDLGLASWRELKGVK